MRTLMKNLRPLLAKHRIFLLGAGVVSAEMTGKSYADNQVVNVQPGLELEPYTTYWGVSGRNLVTMGAFSYTHSVLPLLVSVGRYTSIASGMRVMGEKHPHTWVSTSPVFYNRRLMMGTFEKDRGSLGSYQTYEYVAAPIRVGNDVWIGENVTLGHGVQIGDGAVVASNSVVTKDVSPFTIVGGIPAKKIRDRFDPSVVRELQELRWWDYAPDDIADLGVRDPAAFAKNLALRLRRDEITPYRPQPCQYQDVLDLA
jgi:acetyltransferase-like isoleucine patch superfamily enzyme